MNGMMRWIASLALALMFLPTTANAATDPFLGTWRLDKTKSIIGRDPGVKSKEFVFSPTAEGVMITETVDLSQPVMSQSSRCEIPGRIRSAWKIREACNWRT